MAESSKPKSRRRLHSVQAAERGQGSGRGGLGVSVTTARPITAPSRQVLKRLPERVVAFLIGVGTRPELRALLARGGYCAQAHAEGARLLARVFAYGETVPCDSDPDATAREVFGEIEQWVRANLNRYRLALERLEPDAPNPLVGIDAGKGGDALLAAVTLLARLNELDAAAQDPSGATAEQAASVLQTLARRGLDASQRARLNHWVDQAKAAPAPSGASRRREPRERELLELYQWYKDWSTTARSITRRRLHLIALGLASPRPGKAEVARSSAKARRRPNRTAP